MIEAIPPQKSAVVDIGSNSVRLVIYEVTGVAALPYFNEKVLAGLGRGLKDTGKLSPEGVTQALAALRRYRAILNGLGVTQVHAVATAAVREASDGDAFAAAASDALEAPLAILSGEDEGRLSALGVSVGVHEPEGIVGDLGGSSLEFQQIGPEGEMRAAETHLLGPFSMEEVSGLSVSDRRKAIRKVLKASQVLKQGARRFYAVGGSWRALANVHMDLTGYPLHVLHNYRLDGTALRYAVRMVLSCERDKETASRISSLVGRRYATLQHAALVLDELFDLGGFRDVVISANGLRDGVLADTQSLPQRDPLADGIAAFLRLDTSQYAFGETLFNFIAPVLPKLRGRERIYRAICLMADCGGRFHPDHRSHLAYDLILRAPVACISHEDRALAAHAVGLRYSHKFERPDRYAQLSRSSDDEAARILGAAMRLGAVYSGRSASVLFKAQLRATKSRLTLEVARGEEEMISETVERRLSQLASKLGLEAHTAVAD